MRPTGWPPWCDRPGTDTARALAAQLKALRWPAVDELAGGIDRARELSVHLGNDRPSTRRSTEPTGGAR